MVLMHLSPVVLFEACICSCSTAFSFSNPGPGHSSPFFHLSLRSATLVFVHRSRLLLSNKMMSFTSFLFVVLSLSAKSLAAPAVSVAIDVDLSAAAIAPAATSLLASSASSIIAAAASATAVSDVSTTCTNSAYDRRCWGNGYNINTNWYEDWPDTGVIREVSQY